MATNGHFQGLIEPDPTGDFGSELYKIEAILSKLKNGLIVIGPDGRVVYVNQAAHADLGLKEDACSGSPQNVFQQPDLLEIFDEHRSHPSHCEINLDDGRVLCAQTTEIPEVGLVIVLHDITYLKELDRIKTDFVNTVSHDLRSPLTAILGYVELIARAGPVNEQQREFIHRVQFSVNNITALINDLLDLGRVEAGFDTRNEIVHLPAIILEVVGDLQKRIREKEHQVTIDIADDLPPIIGNPTRLRQMISNLLVNAVKYTPTHGQISLRCLPEDGQIILEIKDNGPGILPAEQPLVFDKFYRGSNVPHDSPGSGLGLAIVKTIVQSHQGRIWLDSTLGQGTTFTIVLPISETS